MSNSDRAVYRVTVTDTFAGEANFCWVRRFKFIAANGLGAIRKLGRHYCTGWRLDYNTGGACRYNLRGAAICCFVEYVEPGDDDAYTYAVDETAAA